jgi:hypothetical protein
VPIVRLQTLLDPDFRVRFWTEGATGMLQGTGRQRDGHPVLEILYLSESAVLRPGAPVVTEGNDGVYPPGVVIGCIASAVDDPGDDPGDSESLRPVVVAFLRPDKARRLHLRWNSRAEKAMEFVSDYGEGAR